MTTTRHFARPLCLQEALQVRRHGGPETATKFFEECMESFHRKAVDRWIVQTGHPLAMTPCTQQSRFVRLIEDLHGKEAEACRAHE